MTRVLLINPNYYEHIFSRAVVRAAINRGTTPLGLVTLAAPLLESGHKVRILDMNVADMSEQGLGNVFNDFEPDIVGITATTPLIKSAYRIARRAKEYRRNVYVVVGGPHASAIPETVLKESDIDCVVLGEGDSTLTQIVERGGAEGLAGVGYKNKDAKVHLAGGRNNVEELDFLPFPAYHLLEIERYEQPALSSRRSPLGYIETSRGCFGRCIYCNKTISGNKVRFKSPGRVVDEMEHMLSLGFEEINIVDDLFTADIKRASLICEEILRRNLQFPWYPRGGVRVDRITADLLKLMKMAGCYRIPFGVESGSQRVLDVIQKGISLEQAERAVSAAKLAGLEIECYFMIGLPTETESDIRKSIEFAIKLNPDYAKFAVTVPLPGTPMFDRMTERGQIKTNDWDKYNFSVSPSEVYEHDNLSGDMLERYSRMSHRLFYFRPKYITKAVLRSLRNHTFLRHAAAFIKTRW